MKQTVVNKTRFHRNFVVKILESHSAYKTRMFKTSIPFKIVNWSFSFLSIVLDPQLSIEQL